MSTAEAYTRYFIYVKLQAIRQNTNKSFLQFIIMYRLPLIHRARKTYCLMD